MRVVIAVLVLALSVPASAQLMRLGGVKPGVPQTPSRSRAQTINQMANRQPPVAVPFRSAPVTGIVGGGAYGFGRQVEGGHIPGGRFPPHGHAGGGRLGHGGVSIKAGVHTPNFKLHVHAKTPVIRKGFRFPGVRRWPYYSYGHGFYYPPYVISNPYYYRDPALTTSQPAPSQQPVQQEAEEEPPPAIDRAMAAFYYGDLSAAIEAVREHLNLHEYDAEAMRLMGLILIESAEVADGASIVRMAYRQDPTMASRPVDAELFGGSRARLRDVLRNAVAFANREGTASGWLAVTVLMQAEGRTEQAGKMLLKARALELDEPIDDAFGKTLGLPAGVQ